MESVASRYAQRRAYSLAQLTDGRILAFDRQDHKPVYLMAPRIAPTGRYVPARGGVIAVRNGIVTSVSPDAAGTAGAVGSSRIGSRTAKQKIGQIVDLFNRTLLLIRNEKAFILQVTPAPDGGYHVQHVGLVRVQGGTTVFAGGPTYDYADDFSP